MREFRSGIRDPGPINLLVQRVVKTGMPTLNAGRYFGHATLRAATRRGAVVESSYRAGTELKSHAHARAHFCVVLEGHYEERLGRQTERRQPGAMSFLPAGCEHAERHHTVGRHLMIEADPASVAEVGELGAVPVSPLTMRRRPANRLATRLARELRHPDAVTPLLVDAYIAELLGELCRERPRPASSTDWILSVREQLDAEPLGDHDLSTLGRLVQRHPIHVARSFRQRFGTSVGGYLRRQRVLWAVDQLQRGDASVADIAVAARFSDQSHLSRWCRVFMGQGPHALRRR